MLSSNRHGLVQKAKLADIFSQNFDQNNEIAYSKWETVNVGPGARTIDITKDGKYIFACVNDACKVSVIDALTMKKITEVDAAKFPVGMSLSPDGKQLVTTSQGKSSTPGSGNTVMVFDVIYEK
jgi:DNA-binding beta-propeller fold protein YncE